MNNENRVMDFLREGYGVEDAALFMKVPLAEVRAVVAGFRADGSLRERLTIWPQHGNFIRCRAGHFQSAENMMVTKGKRRQCRVCYKLGQRRRYRSRNQSIFGSGI